jgi:hypothetical protein
MIVGGLAAVFLAGAPLAAVVTGHLTYACGARAAHAQRAAVHPVHAVLLATAPAAGYTGFLSQVRARWTAPDGARRTGMVLAQPRQRAGSTVRVWADAAGRLTGPPPTARQVRGQAVVAAVLAPVCLGWILLYAGQLAHYLLGRRRLAAWDAEWRTTGPQWTRQR